MLGISLILAAVVASVLVAVVLPLLAPPPRVVRVRVETRRDDLD